MLIRNQPTVQNELESDNEQKKQNRINIAKQNSWQNRAELLSEIIEKLL
jgi:predicted secreted protein